jgi:hypothetical protein
MLPANLLFGSAPDCVSTAVARRDHAIPLQIRLLHG